MNDKFLQFLVLLLFVASCTEKPKSDMATITEPVIITNQPEGIVYHIDTSTSIITWIGTNPTGRHNGIFKIQEGQLNVIRMDSVDKEKDEIVTSYTINSGKLTIDLRSIDILDLKHDPEKYNKLLRHLISSDFFHVDKFPEAYFELTSLEEIEKDSTVREDNEFTIIDPTHMIRGNLTIKGVTKGIEFPSRIDFRNLKLEASAKFNIDRTIWNINNLDENDPVAETRDRLIDPVVNVGFEIIAYSQP